MSLVPVMAQQATLNDVVVSVSMMSLLVAALACLLAATLCLGRRRVCSGEGFVGR